MSEGQQLQISRYLATGAEGGSLYLRVSGWVGGRVGGGCCMLHAAALKLGSCMTSLLPTAVPMLRRLFPARILPPLAAHHPHHPHIPPPPLPPLPPPQVEEVGGDNVRCVAQNSALLDGLLTVMICHTEDNEDFRGDFGLPLLTEHDVDCIRTLG